MPIGTFLRGSSPIQLRGLAMLSFSETGYVLRGTSTADTGGGATTVWGTAGTTACRIDPIGGDESVVAGRLDDRSTHLITCPAGTTVTHNDRFLISGRGTFEIAAVRERTDELARFLEAVPVS